MGDVELAVRPDPPEVPPAQRRPSNTHSQAGYSRRGGDDLTVAVWSLGGPLGLTLFAGAVESAAAINFCSQFPALAGNCSGLFGFAVALGIVSTILIVGYMILFTFARERLFEKSMMYLSAFLFLWWAAGVGATTFNTSFTGPFFVGTQYFATWCAFLLSGLIMHSEWEQFRALVSAMKQLEVSSRSTFYLLIASLIETISAAFFCGTNDSAVVVCSSFEIYALVVGIVSMVLCFALLKVDADKFHGSDKAVSVFLVLWWSAAMGVLTIGGPFLVPGNGFFSTWGAFFISFFVAQSKIFPLSANAAA